MAEELEVNQRFVEPDRALESMRESDSDCYSAFGEVIDNSIQAEANDIRLVFEERKDNRSSRTKMQIPVRYAHFDPVLVAQFMRYFH